MSMWTVEGHANLRWLHCAYQLLRVCVYRAKQVNMLKLMPKLEDANEAGGKRAADCTLILTEGDSAKVSGGSFDVAYCG